MLFKKEKNNWTELVGLHVLNTNYYTEPKKKLLQSMSQLLNGTT